MGHGAEVVRPAAKRLSGQARVESKGMGFELAALLTWNLSTTCLKEGRVPATGPQHCSISSLYCDSVTPGLPGRSESAGMSGRLFSDTVEKMTWTGTQH